MRFAYLFVAAGLVVACGDDETKVDDDTTSAGGASTSTGGATSTGGGTTSTGGSGGATTSTGGGPACDRNGFTMVEDQALSGGQATLYRAHTASAAPYDVLSIQLWHSDGAPTTPHSFTFVGENYSTCHTCGLLGTACVSDLFEECDKIFLVMEGELDVTANAAQFTGTLSNARAVEVTVDWNGDFTSTPVANGETWCLDDYAFDVAVTSPGG